MDIVTDMIAASVINSKNHGQFVKQIAHGLNELMQQGILSGKEKGLLQSCIGATSYGKKN
jgi:hypothetical protein